MPSGTPQPVPDNVRRVLTAIAEYTRQNMLDAGSVAAICRRMGEPAVADWILADRGRYAGTVIFGYPDS
jgi:hypothetical protein